MRSTLGHPNGLPSSFSISQLRSTVLKALPAPLLELASLDGSCSLVTRAIAAVTQLDLVQGNKHSIPTSMHPYYCTASGDWIHRDLMEHHRLKDQLGIDGCSRKKKSELSLCWARPAQSILPGPQPRNADAKHTLPLRTPDGTKH
jgi:hypothetical protein